MGMKLGGRIEPDRTSYCCNNLKALENPRDNASSAINITYEYLTGTCSQLS